MRIGSFVLISIFLVLGISCKQKQPKPPEPTSLDSLLTNPVSTILIPVHFKISDLESIVNKKVQGVFIHEWLRLNDSGDSLYLEIEKKNRIRFSWDGKRLKSTLPLKVSGKFIKRVAGIPISNTEPIETQVVLHLSTQLGLSSRWELAPNTILDKIDWIEDPILKIAVLKINLRKVVEGAIEENKIKLTSKLDDALSAELNTRKSIQKIWTDIQKPIRLNKNSPQIWLLVRPQQMSAKLDNTSKDKIKLNVVLLAFLETSTENNNEKTNPVLPKYTRQIDETDSLRAYILSRMSYTNINQVLNAQLRGRELSAEGYSTKIMQLQLYGIDKGLAIKCKVNGDFDGTIFARAEIGYDTMSRRLFAKDFKYDVETQNALVNAANWLLYDDALHIIKDELQLELQPYINVLPQLIEQGIEKGSVGEKIDINVNNLDAYPLTWIITKEDIQLIVKIDGKASIDLNKKVFDKKTEKPLQ